MIISGWKFVKGVLSDRRAWGDLFHGIGIGASIIILVSVLLTAIGLFFYLLWISGPELFWIGVILSGICLCFKIGDWLKR